MRRIATTLVNGIRAPSKTMYQPAKSFSKRQRILWRQKKKKGFLKSFARKLKQSSGILGLIALRVF